MLAEWTGLEPATPGVTALYTPVQTGTRLALAQNKRGLTTPLNPLFYLWWALSDSNTRPTD